MIIGRTPLAEINSSRGGLRSAESHFVTQHRIKEAIAIQNNKKKVLAQMLAHTKAIGIALRYLLHIQSEGCDLQIEDRNPMRGNSCAPSRIYMQRPLSARGDALLRCHLAEDPRPKCYFALRRLSALSLQL